ncbi:hypothetical protein HMPREF3293_00021 [Christensenella minuta]|uniref:Uncharacterized protein n=1 Tax=Christensenella minuta TaxID=626937 RepID=A0A136Q8W6_9FIRM|nr:hypothetical protein HMPREF3293_00021 [Christensenella minuta]
MFRFKLYLPLLPAARLFSAFITKIPSREKGWYFCTILCCRVSAASRFSFPAYPAR